MRLREILELRRVDVDFHRDEIHITKTKTFRSRVVPMNATVRGELLDHMSRLKSDILFANPKSGKARVSVQMAFHLESSIRIIKDQIAALAAIDRIYLIAELSSRMMARS